MSTGTKAEKCVTAEIVISSQPYQSGVPLAAVRLWIDDDGIPHSKELAVVGMRSVIRDTYIIQPDSPNEYPSSCQHHDDYIRNGWNFVEREHIEEVLVWSDGYYRPVPSHEMEIGNSVVVAGIKGSLALQENIDITLASLKEEWGFRECTNEGER